MNIKRVILIILIALVNFIPAACSYIPPKIVAVDESYSGRVVTLMRYATLTVSLVSNPAAGYSWNDTAGITDKDVIQQTDHKYVPSSAPLPDAPGTQVWTFDALEPGASIITMSYLRPVNSYSPDPAFTLTVVVK